MRIGSLFSGAGGLDMAVESVFGGATIWHCEPQKIRDKETDPWRPNPVLKVLESRWPGVPNLGDITKVDWSTVGPVDILCGGFPCQDISAAGKRAGMGVGTRSGLWSMYATAIDHLRPRYVVIENVRNLLNAEAHRGMESDSDALGDNNAKPILRALGAVLGDLSDIGYDAQWATLAASDVGSCHRRQRVFIVAHPASSGRARLNGGASSTTARSGRQRIASGSAGSRAATDTASHRRHEGRPESAGIVGRPDAPLSSDAPVALLPTPGASDGSGGRSPSQSGGMRPSGSKRSVPLTDIPHLLPTPEAKNSHAGPDYARMNRDGSGGHDLVTAIAYHHLSEVQWGKYEPAIRRWESLTRPAPSPTEPNMKGNPRLSAAFSEWMMGWPSGWVTDVEGISRNDQLRIIGNGVVPQQGAAALRWLLSVCEAVA